MTQNLPESFLPPADALPELRVDAAYPATLNASQELLDRNLVLHRGSRPAIHFRGSVMTYEELLAEVETMGAALLDLGIRRGDRVLLRFWNQPEFVIAWLAALRVGGIVVSTMPLLRARELSKIYADCEPAFLLTQEDLWPELQQALPNQAATTAIVLGASPPGRAAAWHSWEDLMRNRQRCPVAETHADDFALLAYTSGSTGEPKGTLHTHRDLLAIADGYARNILEPVPDDIFGGTPPMAFTFGLGGLLVFPLRFGASTSLLQRFTPEALAHTIRDTGITILFCSATTYNLMLKADLPELRRMCKSLRLCVSAGETLPPAIFQEWKERVGVEVLDGIGSTEMLHIFISNRAGEARPGTTGKPVPGYEARIFEVVEGRLQEVPPGRPGLLAVKGPTGCRYWRRPERQREYVRQGWNFPGDIYAQDEHGNFIYQCRADDLIICGGSNIAGPEVEAVLLEHPSVQECAVVASPDATRGFIPKAFVVVKPGVAGTAELASELQQFVKDRLAPYKYPRAVEFLAALPKTETGKIRRVELRRKELEAAAGRVPSQ